MRFLLPRPRIGLINKTKMKVLLNILIFVQPFLIHAQESINELPRWKVNDTKTVSIERHEVEVENDSVVSDTLVFIESEIKVLKENQESYEISILYENAAYRSAVELYAALEEEFTDYKDFELHYEINKKTGNYKLLNWKETQSFMNTGMAQIESLVEEKLPEMSFWIRIAFAPMQAAFSSEDDTKAFMDDAFGILLYPYGKDLNTSDTLFATDRSPNPFNPMDSVTYKTLTFVTDFEPNASCKIHKHVIHDLSFYKEIVRSMMTSMAEKMDEEWTEEKIKEVESIDFAMSDETTILFDQKTTWPIKVTTVGTVKSNVPGKNLSSTITTTTKVK